MPPTVSLRVDDSVSVETRVWGDEWAQSVHGKVAKEWKAGRTYGTVLRKEGAKWVCNFAEKDGKHVAWARSAVRFEKRAEPASAGASNGQAGKTTGKAPGKATTPPDDSSDEELEEVPEDDDGEVKAANGWKRNDAVRASQRANDGVVSTFGPMLKIPHTSSLYEYALHFLPLEEIDTLAALMTDIGLAKYKDGKGDRHYKDWLVTRQKVLKWIGAWMYILAFPIEGSRREYWTGFEGGFGPKHCLERYGVTQTWFEQMQTCFRLPTYGRPGDAHDPVRRWWDALFKAFSAAIDAGYILNPDESMIQWLGKHMPGFMSVGRKPTDKGCEVHTVCDGICGIMVGGEVFEGAKAMEDAKYCDRYQKSTALTLRLVEPFKGENRIVVADSWFGSVETALALYEHGFYAVLNVKTAHRGYPKTELFKEIWSEKGAAVSKAEAKALGKFPKDGGKRGLHAGFVKVFDVKGSQIELIAGGHNGKQPMLLVSTAIDLLEGEPQKKEWHTTDEMGERIRHYHETPQPRMHAFYRKYFHLVDDHNQLRSGTVTMADVWETAHWPHRHFAESLGFWEVNVFKALVRWQPDFHELKHPQYRRLLAHAMLTGGQPLIIDVDDESTPPPPTPSRVLEEGHFWSSFAQRDEKANEKESGKGNTESHRCGFCEKRVYAYGFCAACFPLGSTPGFAICGPSTGRNCFQQHCNGVGARHFMNKHANKRQKKDEGGSS